jgi:hypothetical protein
MNIGAKLGDIFSKMMLMPFISKTENEMESILNQGLLEDLRKKGHNVKKFKVKITAVYQDEVAK